MNNFNLLQKAPYLRNQRFFPNENVKELSVENDRAYIDIASKVNERIIGLYALNIPVITGEAWFFLGSNDRQQSLRQLYQVPSTTVDNTTIELGFKLSDIYQISPKSYGSYTNGTDWFGLIYASNVPITGQYTFYLHVNALSTTSDQIVIRVGAGAPSITTGSIVVEWISLI